MRYFYVDESDEFELGDIEGDSPISEYFKDHGYIYSTPTREESVVGWLACRGKEKTGECQNVSCPCPDHLSIRAEDDPESMSDREYVDWIIGQMSPNRP